jgi:phosphoribosylglycinamide formyltransferase-1
LTPVAILLSGRGSNFVALAEAMERGEVPARIVLVLSNEPAAPGLERAREMGLATVSISHRDYPGRSAHEAAVVAAIEGAGAEWVCLAGYMRLLSAGFVARFRERLLNIHPSLLPAFPGLDAQARTIEHGVRVSGCTVHLVDEGLDSGPIVVQRCVPVLDDDTSDRLAARILEQEHRAYPEALARLLTERWRVEGRRVVFGAARGASSDGREGRGREGRQKSY